MVLTTILDEGTPKATTVASDQLVRFFNRYGTPKGYVNSRLSGRVEELGVQEGHHPALRSGRRIGGLSYKEKQFGFPSLQMTVDPAGNNPKSGGPGCV